MTQPPTWPKSLTSTIAAQVQRIRGDRGMSAQQLADETAALGYPIPRSVLANLESGRRDAVAVAELFVLARALKVPPLLLVFPVGKQPTIEVLPGITADTWPAAQWFTGEGPFPGEGFVLSNNSALGHFRRQDEIIEDWRKSRSKSEREPDRAEVEDARRATVLEPGLRLTREQIRGWGLTPFPLPSELAHVDEADDGQR